MHARILVLEDESCFAHGLIRLFQHLEPTWSIDWLDDPSLALSAALTRRHDAALIDWNLGNDRSGLDFCRDLRRVRDDAALIVLSGREALEDRVAAIQSGADDFVTKLAEPEELRARVHTAMARVAHRRAAAASATLACGPLLVRLVQQQAYLNGEVLELTRHQWLLLVRLMQQPGEPVSPQDLSQFAGIQGDVTNQNLRTEMRRLRQRLGVAGALVKALRGHGYYVSATTEGVGNDT